jgi:3-hydroxyanthranilate 3,4-dioxygenase
MRAETRMQPAPPFSLAQFVDRHRAALRPPVANRQLYPAGDFVIMVVGGPNARVDYHVDPGAEFFHQLEGTLTLRTVQDGRRVDYEVRAGEVFLLPPGVPHSPQRPAGSVGLVVERRRLPGEQDGFRWYCPACQRLLYEESFALTDIETQFPPIFERFYADLARRTCAACGTVLERPAAPLP